MQTNGSSSRKTECAARLTSSPYKAMLTGKQNAKKKPAKKQADKKKNKGTYEKKKRKKRRHETEDSSDEEDMKPCLICCEPYSRARPREKWVQCQLCLHWAHEECTPGFAHFICLNCNSGSD
jgi:hypothetical protein